jgi:hypothetical protein
MFPDIPFKTQRDESPVEMFKGLTQPVNHSDKIEVLCFTFVP